MTATKNHPAAASYGGMQRPGWVGTNPPTTAPHLPPQGAVVGAQPRPAE